MTKHARNTILLVESEEALRKAEGALLRDLGFDEVLFSGSGAEAWAMIKKVDLNLILSAWSLKAEMNGLGLLKVVRADTNYSAIPFILLVEEITKSQVIEAGESGVTDILLRPFTKETFKRKVEQNLFPEEDPQTQEAKKMYGQGVLYMKEGRFEEALTSFKRILSVYDNAEVYYNMGYIKTAQGKYEEAILAFRRATQINNAFAQAYQKMAEAYSKLGRAQEAQQCFEQAAELFMEKHMEEKAEAAYMQAMKINPNTLNVYNSLGILYRRQGRYQDAIKMYRKALRVSPFDEHIQYNLARVYMAAKDFGHAAETLRSALRISPGFEEASNLLKSLEMGEGLT
ncbi:MAG: tetratricopeptide repeat protein [Thermodesulfobacteriota bacterium]